MVVGQQLVLEHMSKHSVLEHHDVVEEQKEYLVVPDSPVIQNPAQVVG